MVTQKSTEIFLDVLREAVKCMAVRPEWEIYPKLLQILDSGLSQIDETISYHDMLRPEFRSKKNVDYMNNMKETLELIKTISTKYKSDRVLNSAIHKFIPMINKYLERATKYNCGE